MRKSYSFQGDATQTARTAPAQTNEVPSTLHKCSRPVRTPTGQLRQPYVLRERAGKELVEGLQQSREEVLGPWSCRPRRRLRFSLLLRGARPRLVPASQSAPNTYFACLKGRYTQTQLN